MSVYHGWDREELEAVGEALDQSRTTHTSSTSSFTPVNLNHAITQYINPLEMHHDQPVDALPDINPSKVPSTKGKKRRATESVTGRAYSVGAVWEFRDEGDLGYQGQQDKIPPKRRKSAPAKRTKSAKGPHQLLPQIPEPVEGGLAVPQNDDQDQQASQLTTPPDSAKRSKNKPGPKSKKPQLPAFKSLTVTKPVINQEKNLEGYSARSSKIKSQLGWTTTQDAVKLTKTTLDKLASFQFKARTEAQPVATATQYAPTHTNVGKQRSQDRGEGVAPPSSDYCPFPSSDSLFKEACWNAETSDPLLNEPVTATSQTTDSPVGHTKEMTNHSPPQMIEYPPSATPRAGDSTIWHADNILGDREAYRQLIKQTALPRHDFHNDDPTSSEAGMLDGLLDDLQYLQTEQQPTNDESRGTVLHLDEGSLEHPTSHGNLSQTVALEVDGTGTNPEEKCQGLLERSDRGILPQLARKYQPRHSEIQVERSDNEEVEIFKNDVSKDFELDEYDDGLDDADLFEIGSGLVPETQFSRQSIPQESVESIESFPDLAQTGHQPRTKHPKKWTAKAIQANSVIANSDISHLPNSQQDDDFSMDQADEEMMLEAAEQTMGVVETFELPESLRRHAFKDSEAEEVFDRSLQFSPLKSPKPRPSPSKVRSSPSTDKSSNPQSTDMEPLSCEEEHWSFIRREDAGIHVPPENEDYRCFVVPPVPPIPKIPDYFKPQATQQTANSTGGFLDDSHEYQPLKAFVRPDFPALTPDRCPIVGVSTQSFLRVCFRIGEMLKEGGRRNALGQDAVIELFAKVIFSTRQAGTSRQTFQFGDLFFEKGPIASGVLMNYKTTGLADSESKVFVGKPGMMARCLGRLKRDKQTASGWLLHVITVRETDWEEIRWTKRIVSAGLVKSEIKGRSNL